VLPVTCANCWLTAVHQEDNKSEFRYLYHIWVRDEIDDLN